MHPDLERTIYELDENEHRLRRALHGLTKAEFNRPRADGGWSRAEIVHHLIVSIDELLHRFKERIELSKRRGRTKQGRYSWMGKIHLKMIEPPVKKRVKTPKLYRPDRKEHSLEKLMDDFHERHERFKSVLRSADGIDLSTGVSSPVTALFRMSLGQWFLYLSAHERRHLWQMDQMEPSATESRTA